MTIRPPKDVEFHDGEARNPIEAACESGAQAVEQSLRDAGLWNDDTAVICICQGTNPDERGANGGMDAHNVDDAHHALRVVLGALHALGEAADVKVTALEVPLG